MATLGLPPGPTSSSTSKSSPHCFDVCSSINSSNSTPSNACASLANSSPFIILVPSNASSLAFVTESGMSMSERRSQGPAAVLKYLSRYTHRVAIANSRLIRFDEHHVTFKWKDYRAKQENRYKTMTLDTPEFIRRFLIHVLPTGFHRIRPLRALCQCPAHAQPRQSTTPTRRQDT